MLSHLARAISAQNTSDTKTNCLDAGVRKGNDNSSGQMQRMRECASAFEEAYRMLCVCYGEGHTSTQDVRERATAARACVGKHI